MKLRALLLSACLGLSAAACADWFVSTADLAGNTAIYRFDEAGNPLGSFGSGGYLISLIVLDDGTLLASDYAAGTVRQFDPFGSEGPELVTGLTNPISLLVDSNGHLLVGDEASGLILRYALDGTDLGTFANHGMSRQNQLAMDGAGNIYTASHNEQLIKWFAPDGTPLGDFATGASAGLLSPAGLAFDAVGILYVTETLHNEVKRLDSSGNLIDVFANSGFVEPEWLTFDDAGNLFVPGYQSANIRLFDASGGDLGDVFSPINTAYHVVHGPSLVAASDVRIIRGRLDAGDLGSLAIEDGDVLRVCRFIVPNAIVDPVSIEIKGASPVDVPRSVRVSGASRMASPGAFRQRVEVLDSDGGVAGQYDLALTTALAPFSHTTSGAAIDLVDPSGDVVTRVSVRKTGPSTVVAWCFEIDSYSFVVVP